MKIRVRVIYSYTTTSYQQSYRTNASAADDNITRYDWLIVSMSTVEVSHSKVKKQQSWRGSANTVVQRAEFLGKECWSL